MIRTAVLIGTLLVLVAPPVAGPAVADATPATETSLSVTVDGTDLDGERVVVAGDPTLSIEGTAAESVGTVEVRVDGTTRRAFSPDATSFSRTVSLSLPDGDHRVTVVARTPNRTRNVAGTVVRDTAGPRVAYAEPASTTAAEGPPDMVPVATPSIELAGTLSDTSDVASVTVVHTYDYTFGGQSDRYRRRHVIRDPGDAFSQRLFLGIGTNRVEVRLVDEAGNARVHRFPVRLRDRDAPTIRFTRIARVDDGSRVRVEGVVSDDVKVRSVGITGGYDNGERVLVTETAPEPDPDRRSVRFETTVPTEARTGQARVVATDFDGATVSRDLPDEYGRPVAPELRIDGRTRVRDGQVTLRGTAFDGEIRRVVAETTTSDGERIALATVHAGTITRRVEVTRRLDAVDDGPTVVRLRAVDAAGEEHVESVVVGERPERTATATTARTATATTPPADADAPLGVEGHDVAVVGGVAATVTLLAASLVLAVR